MVTALLAVMVAAPGLAADGGKDPPDERTNVTVDLDREMAAKLGLTPAEVTAQIKAKLRGEPTVAELEKIVLKTKDGRFVWLKDVAAIRVEGVSPPGPVEPAADPRRGKVKSDVLVKAFVRLWAKVGAAQSRLTGRQEPPVKLTDEMLRDMTDRSTAFWVTPAEERRFKEGRYDEAANARKLTVAGAELERRTGEVSSVFRYFLEEHKAGRLKGVDLELAVRMLTASLRPRRPKAPPPKSPAGSKLAFRVAPTRGGPEDKGRLTTDQVRRHVDILAANGPLAGRKLGDEYAWFKIKGDPAGFGGLILTNYDGDPYVLLRNRPPGVLMPRAAGPGAWGLAEVYLTTDLRSDKPAIGVKFDKAGGALFAKLTAAHKGRRLAIVVDDKIFSAPLIRSVISDRAVIKVNCDAKTARQLAEALRKGMKSPAAGSR